MWNHSIFVYLLVTGIFGALVKDNLQWSSFKTKFNKTYDTAEEEQKRFEIFQGNLRNIESHNALYDLGEKTFRMGVNQFSDMSREEFVQSLKRQRASRPRINTVKADLPEGIPYPDTIDWRELGAVGKVKNQGSCSSSWAFSTVGTLQAFRHIEKGEQVELSVQQLIDCVPDANGCSGGGNYETMKYIMQYGIMTEESYPYKAVDQQCAYNESMTFMKIFTFIQGGAKDEVFMGKAVGILGPVSVQLDATDLFQYESGILVGENCTQYSTDQLALLVGYNHDNATDLDYWIIQNSWGEDWGEQGFFRIKRGSNECAVARHSAVYAVMQ